MSNTKPSPAINPVQNFAHQQNMVLAIPRGRIASQIGALFPKVQLFPEDDFFSDDSRRLRFSANDNQVDLLRVRAFDVAAYVASGAAHMGIVGSDVLMEFSYDELYTPIDLNIGHCRMVLAGLANQQDPVPFDKQLLLWAQSANPLKIATKYPQAARHWFANYGIQIECFKLHGAVELAPHLGMCDYIVDLVSTGDTIRANQLQEIATLASISSRLIINRTVWKTRKSDVIVWVNRFEEICHAKKI